MVFLFLIHNHIANFETGTCISCKKTKNLCDAIYSCEYILLSSAAYLFCFQRFTLERVQECVYKHGRGRESPAETELGALQTAPPTRPFSTLPLQFIFLRKWLSAIFIFYELCIHVHALWRKLAL